MLRNRGRGRKSGRLLVAVDRAADTTAPTFSNVTVPGDGLGTVAVQATGSFDVTDDNTPSGNITVTAVSNNQNVLPDASIVLGGSGVSRTIAVTYQAAGNVTITIIATDLSGNGSAQNMNINVIQ